MVPKNAAVIVKRVPLRARQKMPAFMRDMLAEQKASTTAAAAPARPTYVARAFVLPVALPSPDGGPTQLSPDPFLVVLVLGGLLTVSGRSIWRRRRTRYVQPFVATGCGVAIAGSRLPCRSCLQGPRVVYMKHRSDMHVEGGGDGTLDEDEDAVLQTFARQNDGQPDAAQDRRRRPFQKRGVYPLHPGYICNRCGKPGHHIRDCPTNGDPAYDEHRRQVAPTWAGVPRNQLVIDEEGKVLGRKTNEREFAKVRVCA